MSMLVLHKLLAVFLTVALGWLAGRLRWLGQPAGGMDPARLLGNAAFLIFVPALLFRTMTRLDLAHLPWATLLAFFVPVLLMALALHVIGRWRQRGGGVAGDPASAERVAAAPGVHAITAVFGNSVQIGIPVVTALFGETGLGIHIAIVSLHALVLLSMMTVLVELDVARARRAMDASGSIARTLRQTLRNTLIHPVVLPVLAGLAFRLTGWSLPAPVDEALALLGTAVAPLCLVLIGVTLAYSSVAGAVAPALALSLAKLLALPALVLAVAHGLFGLQGLALQVVVMMAALPSGSNALLFAQRYRSREAVVTTAIVISTFGYALSAPLWLAVLASAGR